jgi:hypothetical protein
MLFRAVRFVFLVRVEGRSVYRGRLWKVNGEDCMARP